MSSTRSLAAARARRSGETAPPVSGNRPVTSIGSFAQQMPPQNSNVRIARAGPPQQMQQQAPYSKQQPYSKQPQMHQSHQYYEQQPPPPSNGLPFNKLSISDAIGLITLRLGRVEQWIIDTDHEQHETEKTGGIPDNHKIIDNSVLTTMINRIDVLEKNAKSMDGMSQVSNTEEITKLSEEVKKLTEKMGRIGDDFVKHTIEYAKHHEQLFKLNRDLTETKDILKTFMLKYDMFAQEMTQNFVDYEAALEYIEKRIPMDEDPAVVVPVSVPVPEEEPAAASMPEEESAHIDE